LKDLVILLSNLVHPLLTHPLCDEGHLFQSEYRLLDLAALSTAGGGGGGGGHAPRGGQICVHHWFRGGRGRPGRRWASGITYNLSPLLHPLDLVPEVVGDLFGGESGLEEHRRLWLLLPNFLLRRAVHWRTPSALVGSVR